MEMNQLPFASTRRNRTFLLLEVPDESQLAGQYTRYARESQASGGTAMPDDMILAWEAAQPPEPGDLLINEILYQTNCRDDITPIPISPEFVEIPNQRSYALDMQGLFLADTPDRDGQNPDLGSRRVSTVAYPGQWVWRCSRRYGDKLAGNPGGIASFFGYSRPRRYLFGLTGGLNARTHQFRSGSCNLRNHETVFDSVYYSPDWHHPYVYDPRGRSLERGLYCAGSDRFLGNECGILPVQHHPKTNSIALQKLNPQVGAAEPGLKNLIPNPYSPRIWTGMKDHAVIQIQPPGIGYLLRLQIFDRYGRYITTLVDDELVGGRYQTLWRDRPSEYPTTHRGLYCVCRTTTIRKKPGMHFKEPLVLVRRNKIRFRFQILNDLVILSSTALNRFLS